MSYVAKRLRFSNGERTSVLLRPDGMPVHAVTVFLEKYRAKGRAANTLHAVCTSLALLHRQLQESGIDLEARLASGQFLSATELERLASVARYRVDDLEDDVDGDGSNVIHIAKIERRQTSRVQERHPVDAGTTANRMRYIADYLQFRSSYSSSDLAPRERGELAHQTAVGLKTFRERIPPVSQRAKLDARVGLSVEEQARLVDTVRVDSASNPWSRGFVRLRNWLIVVLLLATGMRRGELLGLQIGDLNPNLPKLRVYRRADASEDARRVQANTKTHDREIELRPAIMRALWHYINHERYAIKAARGVPQVFVSDEGEALSESSITKMFVQLRAACPGLTGKLTSHVLRHTWNERFSEEAEAMGLSDTDEERARNSQQGWADNSKTATTYTRRRTARIGREAALRLQEKLDEQLEPK